MGKNLKRTVLSEDHKKHISEGMKKRYEVLKIAKAFYEARKNDYGNEK